MAEVHTIEVPWGQVFPPSVPSRRRSCGCKPTLLALVQGDTSTTMNQPLDELGAICAKHGVLFYTDATASLGGNAVRDRRLGAGRRDRRAAEVPRRSVGQRADHALRPRRRGDPLRARRSRPASASDGDDRRRADFVRSNYFDLGMILDYWGPRRLNHHTEATSMLYARPRVRAVCCSRRGATPSSSGTDCTARAMLAGVRGLGLAVFGDVAHKMNNVVAVEIPDGVPGDAARAALLDGLRHRDRHVVRPAARPGLADRHDGLQRPQGRRADDARRARAGARAGSARGAGGGGVDAAWRSTRATGPAMSAAHRLPSPDRCAAAARRVMARCDELARVTATPGAIERVYLSPEHARVNRLAGRVDARGRADDVAGRRRQPGRPARHATGRRAPAALADARAAARLAPRHRARRRALRRDRSAC